MKNRRDVLIALCVCAALSFVWASVGQAFVLLAPPGAAEGSKWFLSNMPVIYRIDSGTDLPEITADDEDAIIDASFQNWEDEPGSYLDFFRGSDVTNCGHILDGLNVVSYSDCLGQLGGGTLASTSSWFNVAQTRIFNGVLFARKIESDIVTNDGVIYVPNAGAVPGCGGKFDLEGVITHEVGHLHGLDHPPVIPATMYATIGPCDGSKASLYTDDIDGVNFIYDNVTSSATQFTNSTGADIAFYQIGVDQLYVTVTDFDERIEATPTLSAVVTNPSNGDSETFFLAVKDSEGGIYRNTGGVNAVLSAVGTPSNGFVEALSGDVIQVDYMDNDDGSDTSMDTIVVVDASGSPSSAVFTNSIGVPVTYFNVGIDTVYAQIFDFDENTSPSTFQSISAVISDLFTGDSETVGLSEIAANAGQFRNFLGLPTVSSGVAIVENGTLETLNGNTIRIDYVDDDTGSDTTFATASILSVPGTTGVPRFTNLIGTDSPSYVIEQDGIYITVSDPDPNTNPTVAETVQVLIQDFTTGDEETVTLTETGVDTDEFRNTGGLTSVNTSVGEVENGLLEAQDTDNVFLTYWDPVNPNDVSQYADSALMQGAGGGSTSQVLFIDAIEQSMSLYFIGEDVYLKVDDVDENTNNGTFQNVSVSVTCAETGDSEVFSLIETSSASGVFRNFVGIPTMNTPSGTPSNGTIEAIDGATIVVIYQDDEYANDVSVDEATMSGSTGLITDLTILDTTLLSKSQLTYEISYTNLTTEPLGDDETLDPRLRVILFNGKFGGTDLNSTLPPIPILNPGETFSTGPLGVVIPKTSITKIQKVLNSNIRLRSDVSVDGTPDDNSADFAPFKITERDAFDVYFVNQNDENQDVNPGDGFGGIDSGEGEPDGTNNTGNEGFYSLSFPNQSGEVIGTALVVPDNVGGDGLIDQIEYSAADFGPTPLPAQSEVAAYRSLANGNVDFSNIVLPPTPVTPQAANSTSGGDHLNSQSFLTGVVVNDAEIIHVLYFFGAGANDALGIDNFNGDKDAANAVNYERSFRSSFSYSTGTLVPIGGNWIVRLRVTDSSGAFMVGSRSASGVQLRGWNRFREILSDSMKREKNPIRSLVRVDRLSDFRE